jgi:hypothetical protein
LTTPNITAGVTELQKPRHYGSNVVWRGETSLVNGASLTSPIFDCVGDGWPLTQVEIGSASVVRVPSPRFLIECRVDALNMQLQIFRIQDNGTQTPVRTLYVPNVPNSENKAYRFTSGSRRCQFRILNTPLGTVTGTTTVQIEIVNEAL